MVHFGLRSIALLVFACMIVPVGTDAASAEYYGPIGKNSFTPAEKDLLRRYAKKVDEQILSWQLANGPKMKPGIATVQFTISPSGGLKKIKVIKSSGEKNKDMLAMKWVWSAAPFPPPPKVRNFDATFNLPVQFMVLPKQKRR